MNRIQLPRKIHFAIKLDGGAGHVRGSCVDNGVPRYTQTAHSSLVLRHSAMGGSDKSDWLYGKALLDRAILTAESDRLVRNSL